MGGWRRLGIIGERPVALADSVAYGQVAYSVPSQASKHKLPLYTRARLMRFARSTRPTASAVCTRARLRPSRGKSRSLTRPVQRSLRKRLCREAVGYAAYFASYEWLVQKEMERKHITRKEIGMGTAALYGACAGYAMWFS